MLLIEKRKALVFFKGFLLLDIHAGHGPALFCTSATCLGAPTAMLHSVLSMLLAFLGTRIAYFGTGMAKQRGMLSADTHQLCTRIAGLGTFAIQFDAARQHRDVFLVKAFGSAMIAFRCAREASVNTGLHFFVAHFSICFGGISKVGNGQSLCLRKLFSERQMGGAEKSRTMRCVLTMWFRFSKFRKRRWAALLQL